MARARRGLSEVLGALLLVVIMLGVAATIYTAQEKAKRAIVRSVESAEEGLALARSPPSVRVDEENGSVYAIIESDIPATLRGIIVRVHGGGTLYVPGPYSIGPAGPVKVKLYDGPCKPMRIILAPEGAPPLRYPERGEFCSPSTVGYVDPLAGDRERLVFLQANPPESIGEPVWSGTINITISGKASASGPSALNPLRVSVNGTAAGSLTPWRRVVEGPMIGPGRLVFHGVQTSSTYLVLLEIVSSDGVPLTWSASVNASLTLSASFSRALVTCTSDDTWLAPLPLAAYTSGLDVRGQCTVASSYTGGVVRGAVNATARIIAGGRALLLALNNGNAAWITLHVSMTLTMYEPAKGPSVSLPIRGPRVIVNLTAPRIAYGKDYNSLLSANITRLVDPRTILITLTANDTILGTWSISALEPRREYRAPFPSLNATLTLVPGVPATTAYRLEVAVSSNSDRTVYTLSIGASGTGSPQPWAFPARIRLAGNTTVVAAWSTLPVEGLKPVDSVFPGMGVLRSAGSLTVARGFEEPLRYAGALSAGRIEEYSGEVSVTVLESDFGPGSLVYAYAVAGVFTAPWGDSAPVYTGQELWVN